jgi:hypothetical protein
MVSISSWFGVVLEELVIAYLCSRVGLVLGGIVGWVCGSQIAVGVLRPYLWRWIK